VENSIPVKRIQRLSKLGRACCSILICFFILLQFWFLLFLLIEPQEKIRIIIGDNSLSYYTGPDIPSGDSVIPLNFSFSARFFLFLLILIGLGLLIKVLYHLRKLFIIYMQGKIFTYEDIGQLKRAGITGCIMILLNPALRFVSHMAFSEILKGHPELINIIVNHNFFRAIMGIIWVCALSATFICIAWVMERGMEMRENQELTI